MAKRVVKKLTTTPPSEETQPGDIIELSLTEEVRGPGGSRWIKVGLSSAHRPEETSEEAVDRVQNFVIEGLDAFRQASS